MKYTVSRSVYPLESSNYILSTQPGVRVSALGNNIDVGTVPDAAFVTPFTTAAGAY